MYEIGDNYTLFEQHEAEEERLLARCPTCDRCGEKITDEYGYEIEPGELWCSDCAEEWLKDQRKDIDELMEEGW